MYANGQGVTLDFIRAYMWWDIAESKGNANAAVGLTAVEKLMTPAQVENALELAIECFEKSYKDC